VIEQTDQFKKFGKTLARKRILKNQKKSDLNLKNLIFLNFFNRDFFQPWVEAMNECWREAVVL